MKHLLLSENYWNELLLIASIILFQMILGLRQRTYLPLIRSMIETVSTCHTLHFSSSASHSTQGSTIYDLTLNSALSPASTLVTSTI